jgi:hypothetical protein
MPVDGVFVPFDVPVSATLVKVIVGPPLIYEDGVIVGPPSVVDEDELDSGH